MMFNYSPQRTQRTQRIQRINPFEFSVSSVSSVVAILMVSFVSFVAAAPASAQMTGAPTAGYRQQPGAPASAVPAALREIGFDQNLDRPLPLDTEFSDEDGHRV